MTHMFTLTDLYHDQEAGECSQVKGLSQQGDNLRDSWNSEAHSNLGNSEVIAAGHWGFQLRNSQNMNWGCLPRELLKTSRLSAAFLCLLFSFLPQSN